MLMLVLEPFFQFSKNKDAKTLADHCCQKGSEQVVAGYVIYGSSVVMVYTAGNGVHGFTYDPTIGEFLLSHENIRFHLIQCITRLMSPYIAVAMILFKCLLTN